MAEIGSDKEILARRSNQARAEHPASLPHWFFAHYALA
jgi:hypothetical protein